MVTGATVVASIEHRLYNEVQEAQKSYESRLKDLFEEVRLSTPIGSSVALRMTMNKVRSLRESERAENALLIFRSNFPELSGQSDLEIQELFRRLMEVDRAAGRADLMRIKVLRSNIHTVLKPLDMEWNSRFGLQSMQIPAELVQKRANNLLKYEIDKDGSFDIWKSLVFELFYDTLVFQGSADSKSKPIGCIHPNQLRLYKRNWSEWCEKNASRVLKSARNENFEDLEKVKTRMYNMNAELRKQRALQEAIIEKLNNDLRNMSGKSQGEDLAKRSSADTESRSDEPASQIKIVMRQIGEHGLVAQKSWPENEFRSSNIWTDYLVLSTYLQGWFNRILGVWGAKKSEVIFSLEKVGGGSAMKFEFQASGSVDAAKKMCELFGPLGLEIDPEIYFPEKGGSTRTALRSTFDKEQDKPDIKDERIA